MYNLLTRIFYDNHNLYSPSNIVMSKQFNKPNYFLPPGISPGEPPPYHRMDAILFQGLCRDLLDKEPGITTCEIYGKSGQAQYGVDLLAHRAINEGVEVGQCKCYKSFPPVEIRKASEELSELYSLLPFV